MFESGFCIFAISGVIWKFIMGTVFTVRCNFMVSMIDLIVFTFKLFYCFLFVVDHCLVNPWIIMSEFYHFIVTFITATNDVQHCICNQWLLCCVLFYCSYLSGDRAQNDQLLHILHYILVNKVYRSVVMAYGSYTIQSSACFRCFTNSRREVLVSTSCKGEGWHHWQIWQGDSCFRLLHLLIM